MLKYTVILVPLILGIWQFPMIYSPEETQDYSKTMVPFLQNCSISSLPDERGTLRYYTECISHYLGNDKLVSFLVNVGLLPMTYLFTSSLTKKPLAGIISMVTVGTSWMWQYYTPSVSYSQEWTLLFFASLYLINKGSRFGGVVYFASILSKAISLLYCPIVFYTSKRKNIIYTIIPVIAAASLILYGDNHIMNGAILQFSWGKVINEPVTLWNLLSPYWVLLFLIPASIILLSIRKDKLSKYFIFSIAIMLGDILFIDMFTNLDNQHYRLFGLLIMLSAGFGYGVISLIETKAYNLAKA